MAQVTSGLRAILSLPFAYRLFQSLMGAHAWRTAFAREVIKAREGDFLLDLGCGPADIVDYLPRVRYWGWDVSEAYIRDAAEKYRGRAEFICHDIERIDGQELPAFDIVIALGLLHHLDDGTAARMCQAAHRLLKDGGRFITCDPCYAPGQNPIARFLISKDRGRNVRDQAGYAAIAGQAFGQVEARVRHKSGIPYTHCIMECSKRG